MTLVLGIDRIVTMNITPENIGLIDEIRDDKVHGASELARQAMVVLKVAAEQSHADDIGQFLAEQQEIGQSLMSARPAMAPVFNIVRLFLDAIDKEAGEMDLETDRQFVVSKADEAVKDSLQAVAQIAKYSAELIADGDSIMTHSYSSTVVAGLRRAFTEHRNIEVVATRSGAGRTGERIARELGLLGIPVTFIDDTAVGLCIPTINKVMVGADRICTDGKLVNGVGTYPVALAAREADVPLYVLCETLKFDSRLTGAEVDLEEKEASEVVEPGRLPPVVKVKHPYFDITPLGLVTGVVTEDGLLTPEEVISDMQKQPVDDG
ncbi:translation initiation factor eIF-2B [Chloroflexota bacterium]